MKLKTFKSRMKKGIFTWEEAQVVALGTSPAVLKLQLHQWKKAGELISLKRGVYQFSDREVDKVEMARHLYSPCYLSLESALSLHGLLPDTVFAMTLVTTRATRKFNTPRGQFSYQKIKTEAFLGFDPKTLLADPEKAVVDTLYLNRHRFLPKNNYWAEMRWQNLQDLRFAKAFGYAGYFQSKKLTKLLRSLKDYAKSS